MLRAAEQEQIAKITIGAFIEASLNGQNGYRVIFCDPRTATAWLPGTIYFSHYQDSQTWRMTTFKIFQPDHHLSSRRDHAR